MDGSGTLGGLQLRDYNEDTSAWRNPCVLAGDLSLAWTTMPQRPLSEAELASLLLNPFYAITIAPDLAVEHEPLVSKTQWIGANVRMIQEMGAEAYLTRLLDVLEGDCLT